MLLIHVLYEFDWIDLCWIKFRVSCACTKVTRTRDGAGWEKENRNRTEEDQSKCLSGENVLSSRISLAMAGEARKMNNIANCLR